MSGRNKNIAKLCLVVLTGLAAAFLCQILVKPPSSKQFHIRNFRYGKDPSVLRVNRGDTLHLTFSTDDTGHSFFLEEFDMDVKVSPARTSVEVFKTSDPTQTPFITDTVVFEARHKGILNYLISKSNYRCHVWCGPMHAFEQGKLILFPNTLLFFSLACTFVILFLWFYSGLKSPPINIRKSKDLLKRFPLLKRLLVSRWPQIILTILALVMIYVVIVIGTIGTKMSGRNLGVLLMWAVWLFLLVAVLTPLLGRTWCTICPLPFFGDWMQRGSLFSPLRGKTKEYRNKFYGLFKKWPAKLENSWLRLFFFLILSTFSTTLVAKPSASALSVLLLLLLPTVMALIWRKRAFCSYLCPVSVFITPFSGMSPIAISSKDHEVCNKCKAHFCEKGSAGGWACPYGINISTMEQSNDCGMCLECLRSCSYNNVTLIQQPATQASKVRDYSEAWLSIAIFSISIIYSIVYLGTWTTIRDYVNILDKQNWDLFGIYTLSVWAIVLLAAPTLLWLLAKLAATLSHGIASVKSIFFKYCSALLPLGMTLWIAFVIPMLFVNVTFIIQSLSDPLGWGWDFFGTASIPWHQFIPQYIPWLQAALLLVGFQLSLNNLGKKWNSSNSTKQKVRLSMPFVLLLTGVTIAMLNFFVN